MRIECGTNVHPIVVVTNAINDATGETDIRPFAKALGVTPEKLALAMSEAGTSPDRIYQYLRRVKSASLIQLKNHSSPQSARPEATA